MVTTSLATSINDTSVWMPSQQPLFNVSQPPVALGDLKETHVTVQLPTTTAPSTSMSLNHTPLVQTQTPPLLAQNFANAGTSTSAVIVQKTCSTGNHPHPNWKL